MYLHTNNLKHITKLFRTHGINVYPFECMAHTKIIGLFCKRPYSRDYILQKRPTIHMNPRNINQVKHLC